MSPETRRRLLAADAVGDGETPRAFTERDVERLAARVAAVQRDLLAELAISTTRDGSVQDASFHDELGVHVPADELQEPYDGALARPRDPRFTWWLRFFDQV